MASRLESVYDKSEWCYHCFKGSHKSCKMKFKLKRTGEYCQCPKCQHKHDRGVDIIHMMAVDTDWIKTTHKSLFKMVRYWRRNGR